MVCSSGVGFDPLVAGTRYVFDVFGLYNGLFVMDDRQSGSVWTHYDGSVLTGPLAGSGVRLTIKPLLHTTWAEWTRMHPDTMVLDWYAEFAGRYRDITPGTGGLGPQFQATILHWDERLAQNELVLGVNVGSFFRAYVLSEVPLGVHVVNDQLGGLPIVVVLNRDAGFGMAFEASMDGEALVFRSQAGLLVDDTGSVWEVNGEALSGRLAGRQLAYVTSFVTEWYGWAAYHPETSIYGR